MSQGLSAYEVGVIRCVVIFKLLGTAIADVNLSELQDCHRVNPLMRRFELPSQFHSDKRVSFQVYRKDVLVSA